MKSDNGTKIWERLLLRNQFFPLRYKGYSVDDSL